MILVKAGEQIKQTTERLGGYISGCTVTQHATRRDDAGTLTPALRWAMTVAPPATATCTNLWLARLPEVG